ncbi:N-acetylmuramoyl-L-alanine amidase (plasmid) [Streptomyces sp. BI20]|uniref:N-acetylmuramoyl-L-alanine amidase n=1 Tax=Streptomyces sp. BI20 TaxID=3403460 RepID=UPI003C78AE29
MSSRFPIPSRAQRPLGRRGVMVAGAGAAAAVLGGASLASAAPGPSPSPASGAGLAGLPVEPTATAPFSMVGLTWDDPSRSPSVTFQVRTRDAAGGRWRPWRTLTELHHRPDGAEGTGRGGVEPLWVGPSDGVQFRAAAGAGAGAVRALPPGLAPALVDPGTSTAAFAPRRLDVLPDRPPKLVDRAGWGAEESLVADPPQYMADAKAMFVHHTAGGNDYTADEAPAVLRGVFRYHVVDLGWNDIGYNFFVDKYGVLYEGRAGGVDRAVRAAHTYGFNTDTTSVALLGNTEETGVNLRTRLAIARLAAWKLRHHGHLPLDRVTLPAAAAGGNLAGQSWKLGDPIEFHRISGHRDGFNTLCPGKALYEALPEIRRMAGLMP